MAEKYVIFKVEDWEAFKVAAAVEPEVLRTAEALMVPDGTVIRCQDIFAPPALDAYSNTISAAVQVLKAGKGGYDDKLIKHLEDVADYFHEQATIAWETNRKIPD